MSQQEDKTYVDDSGEVLADQELQRAYMDARAELERSRLEAARDGIPEEGELEAVDEILLEEAEDAIAAMEARERRRDTTHRTGGDDHSPGIDSDMDSNAPKTLELPPEK